MKCRDSDKCTKQELCRNVKSVVGITIKESQFTGPEFNFDYSQQIIKTVKANRGASLRGGGEKWPTCQK